MYTYSQWRTSLQRLCLQSFDSPNIQREITNLTDEEVEQYVQENTDAVVAYINSLDTENGYSGKDGTLTQYEMSYFGDKELVEKLIRSLHLDFSLEKGIDMAQFVEVLKKYKQERAGVVLATREYQQQVEGILDPKTTKLQDEEREDIDQYNFNSFLERLEGYFSTHRDLHVDVTRPEGYTMVGHSKRANVETEEAILSKENYIEQMRDYDVFTAVLAKLGYSDERSGWRKFWTGSWSTKQEHETFLARVQNTERGNILDIESIKQYLFDLNGDSVITATMDDGLTEISPYDYVKTHEDTLNFLENLGFPRDFQVLRNLSFRDQFATRLVEVMKLHVPFTVLVQKDGYKNFMKEYLETEQKLREQVMMDLSDADIEEKLRNAGVEITPEAKDIVKQVTVFIAMGHISAFGVNINIKELTHGILDGLNLGMTSKGELIVGVNKRLLEEKRYGASSRLDGVMGVQGVGLHVAVSSDAPNTELSNDTVNLTFGLGVGVNWQKKGYASLSLMMTNPVADNVEGINRMLEREERILDIVVKKLESQTLNLGKPGVEGLLREAGVLEREITEQEYAIVKNNIESLKDTYEVIVGAVDSDMKQRLTERFKQTVLTALVNRQFTQAEGINLTGIGAFCIPGVLAGIFPIFEMNWVGYEVLKNKFGNDIATRITDMELGAFIEKYGQQDGIKFDGKEIRYPEGMVNVYINGEKDTPGVDISRDARTGEIVIRPAAGYTLTASMTQEYIPDAIQNATYKRYELQVTPVALQAGAQSTPNKTQETMIEDTEKFKDLRKQMEGLRSAFTAKTRYNIQEKGGLLDPSSTQEEKWRDLVELAKKGEKYKNRADWKDYDGVGLLGATNLSSIVNSTNNPIEQAFILSKVIQYLKTAKDFGNGRMETWNDNVESYIAKDKKRRNKFDTLFGFSLTDEANAYYKELEKGKGKIGTHSEIGLGFDAAASVKSTDTATTSFGTGVDVFKGDLDMLAVDEKPVLIEIKDQEKITKLTKMVGAQGIVPEGLKFFFYKDPYGFDDRILVKREITTVTLAEVPQTGGISGRGGSRAQEVAQGNYSAGLVPVWSYDLDKPEPQPTPTSTTTPANNPGDSTPQVGNSGSTDVVNGNGL